MQDQQSKYHRFLDQKAIQAANEWFENPRDLVTAIQRIVPMSVELVGRVNDLPTLHEKDSPDSLGG